LAKTVPRGAGSFDGETAAMPDFKNPEPGARLELYVKPDCPYCKAARDYYDGRGIAYVEHDAQHDRTARKAMFAYTGGNPTVPAIVIDGVYQRSGWGDPPRG
jgi:glutaredoxin 3